jgi:hypothetical protein
MIQINLLPDLKKEYIKAQKTKSFVISTSILVTMGAVGLSVLLFIYVTFVQQLQINLATDDIKRKETELKAITDVDKYLTVQAQLAALPDLHNAKGAYDRLFNFLNVLNPSAPNNVNLSTLQLDAESRTMMLTGTTGNFETLNVFVDTLKNAEISYKAGGQGDAQTAKMFEQSLIMSSGFSRVDGKSLVSFTIKTVYAPAVFDVQNTDLAAKVPSITTTQSVTQSPQAGQLFNSNGTAE